MCGIFGMMGPGINIWDIKMLNDLAYISGFRGMDSTGVYQCKCQDMFGRHSQSDPLLIKSTMNVGSFQAFHNGTEEGSNPHVLQGVGNNLFAGHVRHATKGNLSEENAHPFEFDKYVGMHNGTLNDSRYQDKEKTDSELLIKDINERGISPVLKELNPNADAFALVLFNKETNEVSLVRNSQRTLYFCFSASRAVLFWASEVNFLKYVFQKNQEKMLNDQVYVLTPNNICTVRPTDIRINKTAIWDIEAFVPVPKYSYKNREDNKNNHPFDWMGWRGETEETPSLNETKEKTEDEEKQRIKDEIKKTETNLKVVVDNTKKPSAIKHKNSNKIPKIMCLECLRPMTLLEAYEGLESQVLGKSAYICSSCVFNAQSDNKVG